MKHSRCLQPMWMLFLFAISSQNGFAQTLFGKVIELTERQKSAPDKASVFPPATSIKQLFSTFVLLPEKQHIKARQRNSNQAGARQAGNQDTVGRRSSLLPSNSATFPLAAREKLGYGFRRTFLSPSSYATTAVTASFIQLTEKKQPQKDAGDLFADGLSRFAIKLANDSSKRMFVSGIYPALFHQDPRYKPSGKKGFKARMLYAASRVFVVENDYGNLRPNYAQLGGTLTASALANLWERTTPNRDRIGVGPTFGRFARSTSFDVLTFIIFREFGPDIKRKLLRK